MGKVGRKASLRALAVALDHGVTHFDIARSYGFGRAEAVLGEFVAGRRDKVTVTSKFGVVPPSLGLRHRLAMPLLRHVAKLAPGLRGRLRAKSGSLLSDHCFDAAYARQCIDTSLRELRTDYIDIVLLHEPPALAKEQLQALDDLLENEVKIGRIRAWGIAYKSLGDLAALAAGRSSVCQVETNAATGSDLRLLAADSRQRIVTRPFAGGGRLSQPASAARFDDSTVSALGLALAVCGDGGSVVCGMFDEAHIKANAAAIASLLANPSLQLVYRQQMNDTPAMDAPHQRT